MTQRLDITFGAEDDFTLSAEGNQVSAKIRRVAVIGTGVLGSQIAFHIAYSGFDVVAHDLAEALDGAGKRFSRLAEIYAGEFPDSGQVRAAEALTRLRRTYDLREAVDNADLVIEAIPEVPELKRNMFRRLAEVMRPDAILATNSSSLVPSELKDATDRPDRFLALHFANQLWKHNIAEVMGSPDTSPDTFETIVRFARDIGMKPVPINRERPGHILNALLSPFLNKAAELAALGFARPEDIDAVWETVTESPLGPFKLFDIIGMRTRYNVLSNGNETERAVAAWLKTEYLDRGKLGQSSGEGFYRYDSPSG